MTFFKLLKRSLSYYLKPNAAIAAAAAVSAVVLTGALIIGDSVNHTIRSASNNRIGKIDYALPGKDRFVSVALSDALTSAMNGESAPVLYLRGSVTNRSQNAYCPNVNVFGVDDRFGKMASTPWENAPDDGVYINNTLARDVDLTVGDKIILRMERGGYYSKDAPLSGESTETISIRSTVRRVLSDSELGSFSLSADLRPTPGIFLPIELLQKESEMDGKCNLILLSSPEKADSNPSLQERLQSLWKLEDLSLSLKTVNTQGDWELRSSRIFIDSSIEEQITSQYPQANPILSYFINTFEASDKSTPYSMVGAASSNAFNFIPENLADNEIVINRWLADDLNIDTGDSVNLHYYEPDGYRLLSESSKTFTVHSIIPMNSKGMDTHWLPDFPGISEAENSHDWEAGPAIDLSRIRDKDEEYWDDYRGTPKAFLNLKTGNALWANEWGRYTAFRFPANISQSKVAQFLLNTIAPSSVGLDFINIRHIAEQSNKPPVDFGQLFLAFSLFLLIASCTLTSMLFILHSESREKEAGTLLALGITQKSCSKIFLCEGAILAATGSISGSILGAQYAKSMLYALQHFWVDSTGGLTFDFHFNPVTILSGTLACFILSTTVLFFSNRKRWRRNAIALMNANSGNTGRLSKKARGNTPAAILLLLALSIIIFSKSGSAPLFFLSGSLLLISGLLFCRNRLLRSTQSTRDFKISQLTLRSLQRQHTRSILTIGMTACGIFMIISVTAFRKMEWNISNDRQSGTGGFSHIMETAVPLYDNPDTLSGRNAYGLDDTDFKNITFLPFRKRPGDDASCLNLNRAIEPTILAVDPQQLIDRNAFKGDDWSLLLDNTDDKSIPCFIDQASLLWALQMSVGDRISYQNDHGESIELRIAGVLKDSIFQGSLIISEKQFKQHFNRNSGHSYFLIENANSNHTDFIKRIFSDHGARIVSTKTRLNELHSVENAYISIFQTLGGLGVIIGSLGLGIVMARSIHERRSEFALMQAVGFSTAKIQKLLRDELIQLTLWGLGLGCASSLIAVWPTAAQSSSGSIILKTAFILSIVVACMISGLLPIRSMIRKAETRHLRNE